MNKAARKRKAILSNQEAISLYEEEIDKARKIGILEGLSKRYFYKSVSKKTGYTSSTVQSIIFYHYSNLKINDSFQGF